MKRAILFTHRWIGILSAIIGMTNFPGLEAQTRCDLDLVPRQWDGYLDWKEKIHPYHLETRDVLTVPVVVHIVYRRPDQNISDAQIHSQIDALNRAFTNPGDLLPGLPREFASLVAIPGIRFCLASQTPAGAISSGITRTSTNLENIGLLFGDNNRRRIHYTDLGGQDAWDPNRYFNIWVGELGGLLGRASMPGTLIHAEEDGIIISPEVFGTTGSVVYPFHQGKTAVHETGHYLGLAHLWGMEQGDCTEDDGLADTPQQAGPYSGCPAYPQTSCGSNDLFMNYMDFTDDPCLIMFTRDQVDVMRNTLEQYRSGLINQAAGCNQPPRWKSADQELHVIYRPEHHQLEIQFRHAGEAAFQVRIWDVTGRLVLHQMEYGSSVLPLSVPNWVLGIYFVEIITPGNQLTKKVLIY
ncbi:MAG: M43 family zinc metalloprotease [Saprospiraceae bacterium]